MMHGALAHGGVTPPLRVSIARDVVKREADALAVRLCLLCCADVCAAQHRWRGQLTR